MKVYMMKYKNKLRIYNCKKPNKNLMSNKSKIMKKKSNQIKKMIKSMKSNKKRLKSMINSELFFFKKKKLLD